MLRLNDTHLMFSKIQEKTFKKCFSFKKKFKKGLCLT